MLRNFSEQLFHRTPLVAAFVPNTAVAAGTKERFEKNGNENCLCKVEGEIGGNLTVVL